MKTNEMSLQDMQETSGGAAMPPMPENPGAGDLTIRNNPEPRADPYQDPTALGEPDQPNMFGGGMFS